IGDAVEAQTAAKDARTELASRGETARVRLLGGEREAVAVARVGLEFGPRERDVGVRGEPLRELDASLELDALAPRRAADFRGAFVAAPHRLAGEVEAPERD